MWLHVHAGVTRGELFIVGFRGMAAPAEAAHSWADIVEENAATDNLSARLEAGITPATDGSTETVDHSGSSSTGENPVLRSISEHHLSESRSAALPPLLSRFADGPPGVPVSAPVGAQRNPPLSTHTSMQRRRRDSFLPFIYEPSGMHRGVPTLP